MARAPHALRRFWSGFKRVRTTSVTASLVWAALNGGLAGTAASAATPLQSANGLVTVTLGPVELETHSPVTITLENSTNLYIQARNTGNERVTIQGPLARSISVPSWVQHFFELNPFPVELGPGETTVFEFMLAPGGEGNTSLAFPFKIVETGEQASVTIEVSHAPLSSPLPLTATIQGRVTASDGTPLMGKDVTVYMFNPANEFRGQTDGDGRYAIQVPSIDDLREALGTRPLPYHSLGYSVIVAPEGYALGYRGEIEPARNTTVTIDFTLDQVALPNYVLTGEHTTEGGHGYFWLYPSPGFDRIFAVQGRHPPELHVPGHIIAVDRSGNELWRQPTGDECWGFDVSVTGDVAAGCHDSRVYLMDANGNPGWQLNSDNVDRAVRFSPDGNTVLTGPFANGDAALLDVGTGQVLWTYRLPDESQWLRHARWSPDGQRVVTGYGGGIITTLTSGGDPLSMTSIGEFPMVLEMDNEYNTYMAGKSRELFSFNASGNLRWRRRVAANAITAGANNMSADGALIVIGTVGGWVQAYNRSGDLLWQRRLPGTSQGHNALDVTPDGAFVFVGVVGETGRDGHLVLYDRNGTLLWQTRFPDKRDTGEVSSPYPYEHPQRGVITVAISDDGRYLAAGYGDGTLRIFEQQNDMVQSEPPPVRLGINFPFRGLETAPLSAYMGLLSQSGAPAMRYLLFADVYWKNVEPSNDAWNFVYPDSSINNPYNILAFPTLYSTFGEIDTLGFQVPWRACSGVGCGWQAARDSSDSKDYVQTVVARYKSVVKYWEIGNEVTLETPRGLSVPDFAGFMHLNYRWIKEADPEAHVVYPGLPGTYGLPMQRPREQLRQFLSAGGVGSFDILSYHDYNSWWTLPAHYDSLKALLSEFGLESIPIWCTESSVSSDPSTSITPPYSSIDEQAADVWRRPAVLFARGLQVYFWHSMWSSGGNSNWREFGILSATGEKKKAFHAFKLLTEKLEQFSGAKALSFGEVTEDNTRGGNGVWVVQFDWPDGTRRWVAWSPDNRTFTWTNLSASQLSVTTVVPESVSQDGETATFDIQNVAVTDGSVQLQLSGTPVLVEEDFVTALPESEVPISFELSQNYPNPFNPSTTIRFSLPQREQVTLKVFNVLGREVATLVDKELNRGTHVVVFEGKDLASGLYFYKLQAGRFIETKKMMLLK